MELRTEMSSIETAAKNKDLLLQVFKTEIEEYYFENTGEITFKTGCWDHTVTWVHQFLDSTSYEPPGKKQKVKETHQTSDENSARYSLADKIEETTEIERYEEVVETQKPKRNTKMKTLSYGEKLEVLKKKTNGVKG